MPDLNEHTFEIKFKPNPTILDFRGYLAQSLSSHINLTEWKISENKIDVYDKEINDRLFVGYKNAGYVLMNATSESHFYNKVNEFYKFLSTLKSFGTKPFVYRIGLRIKFLKQCDCSFERLRDFYIANFISPAKNLHDILNANLLDIGAPLDLKDDLGQFHFESGPMKEEQSKQYFSKKKQEFPPIGFFLDIDYSINPKEETDDETVTKNIVAFSSAIWDKYRKIVSLLSQI